MESVGAGDLFSYGQPLLSPETILDIQRFNPWWLGKPGQVLPPTRRVLVPIIHRRLEQRLAPIVVLRGPRQIGKTIAHLQVIQDLLSRGVHPRRILRVQFDDLAPLGEVQEPILRIADWYERDILKKTLNEAAQSGEPAYLFLDEIQNLPNWAPQLKSLVDSSTVQVVVTGSSALRIEAGRDSLAGRITTIEAGTLSLTEIASFHGLEFPGAFLADNGLEPLVRKEFWRDLKEHGLKNKENRGKAFAFFSERGSYPIAHDKKYLPWTMLADQLNETVIRRVIKHDLRMGERGRKRDETLLEELFRLACRYAGQAPSSTILARETQRALQANVGPNRINIYMKFLSGSLLIRLVEPLEIRLKRKRGAPKICLADHGLRASWLQEIIPLTPEGLERDPALADLAGHLAESVVGATLATVGELDIAHFPERPEEPEVDFVLTVGTKRIPLEVKYQRRIDPLRHTEGLRTFLEKAVYNAPFGLLITQTDDVQLDDPRIVAMSLSTFMMLR